MTLIIYNMLNKIIVCNKINKLIKYLNITNFNNLRINKTKVLMFHNYIFTNNNNHKYQILIK